MAFKDDDLIQLRPYLYHLTNRDNVEMIRNAKLLYSAASLMHQADDVAFLRRKRKEAISIRIGGRTFNIRDQQPLHAGNIQFQNGWSFEDVIQALNERVFFWPGHEEGPNDYGERHFRRYVSERPTIVRIKTADLFNANGNASPFYCRYNSGSPRCTQGHGSPRGQSTFVRGQDADYTAGMVVEVTLVNQATLPAAVEIGASLQGPWTPL